MSVAALNAAWAKLERAENGREEALKAELERQSKIANLLNQFRPKAKAQDEWNAQKETYLNEREKVDTVSAAQMFLKLLEAYEREYQASKPRIEILNHLGKQIIALRAAESGEVQEKMDSIAAHRVKLEGLAEQKKVRLNEELALQQRMEALRKEFANLAKDFNRWIKDTIEKVGDEGFGESLDAVRAFAATIESQDAEINEQSQQKKIAADKVWDEMQSLGVKDNKYTPLAIGDLEISRGHLNEALQKRRHAHAEELKRQEAMEAKRKELAEANAKFIEFLAAERAALDQLQGEPEALSAAIADHHQNGAKAAAHLAAVVRAFIFILCPCFKIYAAFFRIWIRIFIIL